MIGFSACLSLSGCGMMEMSFKAGFIMALILAGIIGLLVWIFHIGWMILTKYFPNIRLMFEGFWKE
ncbi:MAG: hypothetical protein JWP37_2169 [Mucilaginibacter sp.]|nr:hypothetical protein [Mucilaginibacter sp.]